MVLKADDTLVSQTVLRSVAPLAAGLLGEPVIGPSLELEDLLTVEPVLHMAVVEDDLRGVPLADGVYVHLVVVGQVHGVIHTQLLPLLEFGGGINLLPALVVDELILGTRYIRHGELGILDYVVEHAAVAAVGEFPVPYQLEVGVFLVGHDVT